MSKYDLNKINTKYLHARIDEVIDRTLAEKRLVGAVVQVALNGTHCYSRASGFADREQSRFMQDNTLFRIQTNRFHGCPGARISRTPEVGRPCGQMAARV